MKKPFAIVALSVFLVFPGTLFAMDASLAKASPQATNLRQAFQLYKAKCTSCHEGVADPDKAGKTRDDWHIVIKLMHDLGVELTPGEEETLVDYFFTIRKGMEKEAG